MSAGICTFGFPLDTISVTVLPRATLLAGGGLVEMTWLAATVSLGCDWVTACSWAAWMASVASLTSRFTTLGTATGAAPELTLMVTAVFLAALTPPLGSWSNT